MRTDDLATHGMAEIMTKAAPAFGPRWPCAVLFLGWTERDKKTHKLMSGEIRVQETGLLIINPFLEDSESRP